VRALVEAIEIGVIKLLDSYGIEAYGRRDAPGVYVKRDGREAKIAALGLKVRNGCTYHGFALNLDMDLAPFEDIDPCGYRGLAVTHLRDFAVGATRREIEDRLLSYVVAAIGRAPGKNR
jgi:lipoyl(octanoyl) transferase